MRTFQTISANQLLNVTGGARRLTVRPNNDEIVKAMTALKSDVESLGKAKSSSSSSMTPMIMAMMMQKNKTA